MDGTRGNKEIFLSEILSGNEFPAFAGRDHFKAGHLLSESNDYMTRHTYIYSN